MIRTAGAHGLGWIDRMLNASTRQMRRECSSTVRTSLALVVLVFAGGFAGRALFGLLFFGFGRGIPGPFLFGHLLSSFPGRLADARLQFLRIDFFRTRTKEVPLVNRDQVLQIAPKLLQFLHPTSQCFVLGLQLLGPRAQLLEPIVFKQIFYGTGITHRQSLWRAWPLRA